MYLNILINVLRLTYSYFIKYTVRVSRGPTHYAVCAELCSLDVPGSTGTSHICPNYEPLFVSTRTHACGFHKSWNT